MEESTHENVEQTENNDDTVVHKTRKLTESGVIYLSRIPTMMNVKIIRQTFGKYGEVGRIFLQPDGKGRKASKFSEGWVEFRNKKIAKQVATSLNNTQVGGKKRQKWFDELWNIKYLSRFKWSHLNERLAYEKAVHSQRMRTEISQAKREANFHIENAEKRARLERKRKKEKLSEETKKERTIPLKSTEDEIVSNKKRALDRRKIGGKKQRKMAEKVSKKSVAAGGKSFLSKIFSSGVDD